MHVAQLNVARARTPLDAPEMDDFMALLDPVNEVADRSPGFVWRLEDEEGNATSIRAFDDDRIIVNMSVWESIDALWSYVYEGAHMEVMRRRREWFRHFGSPAIVLWWIPAGQVPTVEDGQGRAQAGELADVPRAGGVVDRADRQEERCLEEAVGQQHADPGDGGDPRACAEQH